MKAAYDIYLNTSNTGIVHAADCVIEELNGKVQRIGFRYKTDYLNHTSAFSVDPHILPLKEGEFLLHCDAGLPGFLDDYLPDDWGKKVLTRLAFYRQQQRLNSHSAIDLLSLMGNRRIGALCITAKGEAPHFEPGLSLEHLSRAELAAQHIDDVSFDQMAFDEMNLLYLASSGSGVGGARPKALIADNGQETIAKFNRTNSDHFNNARVELACLQLAKLAGLNVGNGKIVQGINGRDALLLERFDVIDNHRAHLMSVNSLLKNPITLADHGFHFHYDGIFKLLQKFSINIEQDAEQLLLQMLFNRAINNVDDHERNFSLINKGEGYQLSPAYDLVPVLARGQYHVAGFQYQPNPPKPSEISTFGKVFGLSKPQVARCAEQVITAVSEWENIASRVGVEEKEVPLVQKYFNL
jgi:serine/threonine-protein kinase HipA